jgi:hypothetical protein
MLNYKNKYLILAALKIIIILIKIRVFCFKYLIMIKVFKITKFNKRNLTKKSIKK